jgi:hypothetical protein
MKKDQTSSGVVAQSTANAVNRSQELTPKQIESIRIVDEAFKDLSIYGNLVDMDEARVAMIKQLRSRPTPVSVEGLREKIEARIDKHESIGYGEDDSIRAEECRDILSLIDSLTPHPDTPEPSGEETTTIRTRIVKNHADGSSELISDTTRQGNPKPINPVSPPKTDQEIISEAVRDFAKFYDGVTANGSSSMVDRFLTERFNHPPKTEGDYKCEGCGCDTDMIQPYCHQCEHESIVKNEVRLALEEASQAILSKRFFAERGHFGGEQAVRVKDIQQAFITPLTNK